MTDDTTKRELLDWLNAKRRHVRAQVEAIPEADRRRSLVPSGWTPMGMVHHLAFDVERVWFRAVMAGEPVGLPKGYAGWLAPDDRTDEELLAAYDEECALADEVIARLDLDDAPRWWFEDAGDPPHSTLREVLVHVLVETSTHAGHLDIVRELVDGGQRLVLDTPD
jgi:uncharacterized damage-inducible protein DinB